MGSSSSSSTICGQEMSKSVIVANLLQPAVSLGCAAEVCAMRSYELNCESDGVCDWCV